jgi:hypothetical protein
MSINRDAQTSIQVASSERVFPAHHASLSKTTTPLSILDASVANYSPTAGIWFYDAPTNPSTLNASTLQESLIVTLDAYPQWAGQLGWTSYNPHATGLGAHTCRFHRLQLSYGNETDPGVEFITAQCDALLSMYMPSAQERVSHPMWDSSFTRELDLLPKGLVGLALRDVSGPEKPNTPGVIIQVTHFACGGVAVAVGMSHPLADASSLVRFMHDWASTHRHRHRSTSRTDGLSSPSSSLQPVFDPSLIDEAATGDIDAIHPEPPLEAKFKTLPVHGYDFWASAEGAPAWAKRAVSPPPEYVPPITGAMGGDIGGEKGKPLPWAEWDVSAPVSRCVLHFSPEAIAKIYADACSSSSLGLAADADVRVSRLDALLALVWALIVRARRSPGSLDYAEDDAEGQVEVYMDMTLGVRQRLVPPLPDSFVGSPLINAYASLPSKLLTSSGSSKSTTSSQMDLHLIARAIRQTVTTFDDPHALPAMLHVRAFAACPHALWDAFLGRRHTIVTSWLGLDVYGVDFVSGSVDREGVRGDKGGRPRYVESVMPDVDGCVQIGEAGYGGLTEAGTGTKWYEETVGVRLHVRTDVLDRIREDELLRRYSV